MPRGIYDRSKMKPWSSSKGHTKVARKVAHKRALRATAPLEQHLAPTPAPAPQSNMVTMTESAITIHEPNGNILFICPRYNI